MTYEELQQKIADVENMIDVRFAGAMEAYHTYYMECIKNKKVVVKPEPERSQFEHQAMKSIGPASHYLSDVLHRPLNDAQTTTRCQEFPQVCGRKDKTR